MKLGDTEYKLAFTMSALAEIEEKVGEIEDIEKLVSGKHKIKNLIWLFTVGINAWILREKMLDPSFELPRVTEERVGALMDFSKPKELVKELMDSFGASMRPQIEIDDDELPDPNGNTA